MVLDDKLFIISVSNFTIQHVGDINEVELKARLDPPDCCWATWLVFSFVSFSSDQPWCVYHRTLSPVLTCTVTVLVLFRMRARSHCQERLNEVHFKKTERCTQNGKKKELPLAATHCVRITLVIQIFKFLCKGFVISIS